MGKITAKVEAIAGKARAALSAKDAAREKALRSSRDAVRYCSEAIRSVHRGEYSEARERLSSVREILDRMNAELEEHQDLLNSGFVPIRYAGMLIAITMMVCAGGALTILAAAVTFIKPK